MRLQNIAIILMAFLFLGCSRLAPAEEATTLSLPTARDDKIRIDGERTAYEDDEDNTKEEHRVRHLFEMVVEPKTTEDKELAKKIGAAIAYMRPRAIYGADPRPYTKIEVDRSEKWSFDTFYLYYGSNNRVSMVTEGICTDSGDWEISYFHYFGEDGRTMAFEIGIASTTYGYTESSVYFLSPEGRIIKKTYEMKDHDRKKLDPRKQELHYGIRDTSTIYLSLESLDKDLKLLEVGASLKRAADAAITSPFPTAHDGKIRIQGEREDADTTERFRVKHLLERFIKPETLADKKLAKKIGAEIAYMSPRASYGANPKPYTKVKIDRSGEWSFNTFYLFYDSNSRVAMVADGRSSDSGDWVISYIHYFGKDGRTIAFESRIVSNTYDYSESSEYLLSPEGRIIAKTYQMKGYDGKKIDPKTQDLHDGLRETFNIYLSLDALDKDLKLLEVGASLKRAADEGTTQSMEAWTK